MQHVQVIFNLPIFSVNIIMFLHLLKSQYSKDPNSLTFFTFKKLCPIVQSYFDLLNKKMSIVNSVEYFKENIF